MRRAAQIVDNARMHQKLRKTEERFRVALAHSNITLFEQDEELRYRWIYNPPLGFRAADVLGKTNAELVSPEEAARLGALDRAVLESGERIQDEVQISAPGGETRHLLVTQEPLRDASGATVGLIGAATDITDQKRAQEQLAQALVFREQMMGILGHDLRNPLSAVRALASILERREDLPQDVRECLTEIDRAGQRMLEMIGTLLDFTHSRFKGGMPIAPVPMDLDEVCRRVVDELLAAEPGRTIELDLAGDGRGTWDPARMAQVVSNLVANALEHGAKHGAGEGLGRRGRGGRGPEVENQGAADRARADGRDVRAVLPRVRPQGRLSRARPRPRPVHRPRDRERPRRRDHRRVHRASGERRSRCGCRVRAPCTLRELGRQTWGGGAAAGA